MDEIPPLILLVLFGFVVFDEETLLEINHVNRVERTLVLATSLKRKKEKKKVNNEIKEKNMETGITVRKGPIKCTVSVTDLQLGLGFGIGDWLILDKVSDSSVTTIDGRKWVGDLVTNKNVTLSSVAGVAVNTSTTLSGDSIFKSLYKSARIFADGLNYTFEIVPGNYIVRLHFCPFPFENYNVNESSFSVVANGFKLLSQLSVPGEISHKNMFLQNSGGNASFSLVKEYMLGIHLDMLRIELIPNKGSFGFVNAIEIVPVVDELFADAIRKVGGNDMNFNLSGRGIETMYRLNVGGPEIKPNQDSDFWRTWEVDSSYMITANAGSEISNTSNITYSSMNDSSVAPVFVYETARIMSNNQVLEKRFNMSWKFEVDPDFDYLVRLHFCELVYDKAHQRIFRIYINNRTAANNFDIFAQSGGMNRAYHQDYFDAVSSKVDTLWIQLGPDTAAGASGTDALLNGLEVFKLSRNGNLAYVEKYDSAGRSGGRSKNWVLWVGMAAGIASVAILAVIVTIIFYISKNRREKTSDAKNNSPGWCPLFLHRAKGTGIQNPIEPMAPTRVGKRFMLAEIRAATNNFDDSLVIGVGGFGKVYKGEIEDGSLAAIKRANPQSEQGLAEFETEIEMLSKLRHRHLVTLIGFCEEQNEMILVYEYMANGTLRSHLFGGDLPPLSWKQRLDVFICARAVINPTLPKDQINLADWAMKWQRQRSLESIIDQHLRGNYCPESLEKYGEIAEKCLDDEGKNRPTMGEVLWHLEYVLQLHEAWMRGNDEQYSFAQEVPTIDEENNSSNIKMAGDED
ncbi:hypothetical protein EZV62_027422 [Acer yangbiense]|uniref:Protein kinase domain-containing protein n=1 Tax=Acer yangbiense TaxID=1000413 RepID=A0A5C7GTQ6_9ROSI|nr:hypothetical protein EZV62_027422 [Acer yangbiense]